jgi:hypothetical protein
MQLSSEFLMTIVCFEFFSLYNVQFTTKLNRRPGSFCLRCYTGGYRTRNQRGRVWACQCRAKSIHLKSESSFEGVWTKVTKFLSLYLIERPHTKEYRASSLSILFPKHQVARFYDGRCRKIGKGNWRRSCRINRNMYALTYNSSYSHLGI